MISIENVSKKIRGIDVLRDVTFEVPAGTVVGLEGPNGSGKTMLMRCVAGLVRPSSGKIVIDGRQLFSDIEFPPSLGMLIENPAFLDNRTGAGNLRMLASIKASIGQDEIADTLRLVGLDPDDRRSFRKYSLGMKQRLGLAAAFMESPDILLLDEPVNALDNEGIELFADLLGKAKARGASTLISCHDKSLLRKFADEVRMMSEGRVVGHEYIA